MRSRAQPTGGTELVVGPDVVGTEVVDDGTVLGAVESLAAPSGSADETSCGAPPNVVTPSADTSKPCVCPARAP